MSGPGLPDTIAANLAAVRSGMERAAARAGRDPASIRLLAISKTFGIEHIRAAAAAGQRDFGENRIQEALPKIEATVGLGIRWHLVGHLQSNKVRKAVGAFELIHSVDSSALLQRLDDLATEAGRTLEVLIQVDLAGEATKFGAAPDELPGLLDRARSCHAARVRGLMALPPYFDDPEGTRPFFRRLRRLRDEWLEKGVAPALLAELSMGMSHDFEVAIEEGATLIRVGTAIFGERS